METYLSPKTNSLLREFGLALLGKKKNEAEENLQSAKKLILKVKRMGMDTKEAEGLYLEAKADLKNKKYGLALQGIEDAKKSAKKTYSIGIKAMLEIKISQLDVNIKRMRDKNINTDKAKKLLAKARSAKKGKVRENKEGLKAAKEGIKLSNGKLSRFDRTSEHLVQSRQILRKIRDYDANITIIETYNEKMDKIEDIVNQGNIDSAEDLAKDTHNDLMKDNERFQAARRSIEAFQKVISDSHVLGTKFDSESKLKDAREMLLKGEFISASQLADNIKSKISPILQEYKETKHFVDTALVSVQNAKEWGFSTDEVQKILDSAKEALINHDFELAKAKSEECRENAINIRERHKESLDLIQKAKDELRDHKAKGHNTENIEIIIDDAESEFNKGNYKITKDKLDRVFEAFSGLK